MKKYLDYALFLLAGLCVGSVVVWYISHGRCAEDRNQVGPNCEIGMVTGSQNIVPVAVIGSGPAGLMAATYCARSGLHTVVFEGDHPGGQLMETTWVENWPGMPKTLGPDLIKGARQQAMEFGALFARETVKKIDVTTWPYGIEMASGLKVNALSVIITTGATPRKLTVPGFNEYWGKGITTCATCDAPFYKHAIVVVIGGGDAAVEQALQLVTYADRVTILVRGEEMRASPQMKERLKAFKQITIRYKTEITEIKGDSSHVKGVVISSNGHHEEMETNGVFLAIGHLPNTEPFRNIVDCDDQGCIKVLGRSQCTSMRGIFAAGDVADPDYRQAGIAAGDGIKAALDAEDFLRSIGYSEQFEETVSQKLYSPEGGHGRKALNGIGSLFELKKILKEQKTVVLDFYTEFCPSCMQLLPILEVASTKWLKVGFYKVNAIEAADIAKKFDVVSVPTLLVLYKGDVIARMGQDLQPSKAHEFLKQAIETIEK